MSLARSVLDTVGIELESAYLTNDKAIEIIQSDRRLEYWKVHHDSSINTSRYGNYKLLPFSVKEFEYDGNNPLLYSSTYGAEIVSPPLDLLEVTNWQDQIKAIINKIYEAKELPQNETSVHFHINCTGVPLFVVQNLIRIWNAVEASIFRLSVAELGYHRGEVRKDYMYCRPLYSPQVVFSRDGELRYSFNTDRMLEARTFTEFFHSYGNVEIRGESQKYHPARYSAVNFFSLNTLGTIEFRTFNMTNDWQNIIAWIRLCQSIVKQSMGKLPILEPQPLGFNDNNFNIPHLQSILEFNDETAIQLEKLWNTNRWCKPVQDNLFTHSQYNRIVWNNNKQLMPPKVASARQYINEETWRIINSEEIPERSITTRSSNESITVGYNRTPRLESLSYTYAEANMPTLTIDEYSHALRELANNVDVFSNSLINNDIENETDEENNSEEDDYDENEENN